MGTPLTIDSRPFSVAPWLRRAAPRICIFLFWALVFGLCYTQQPLFSSNQNHRFLPGLAAAGEGELSKDWLAGTTDPTPVFSYLVWFTHRFLDDRLFHVYYALLQSGYLLSLAWIGCTNTRLALGHSGHWVLLTLLVAVHSLGAREGSKWLTGTDFVTPLQTGVAGQYILGPVFQPSVVGVFLIYSIAAFLAGRPVLAILCSSIALIVHPTYLLSAALLTVAYLVILAQEQRYRHLLRLGLFALTLALPVVITNALVFRPTDAETFARANFILAQVRFPHHCVPDQWLNDQAYFQATFVVLSLWLVRDGRLLTILAVSVIGSLLLTSLQMETNSDALALLFPWRPSVYLVPLALTIFLGQGIALVKVCIPARARDTPKLRVACLLLLAAFVFVGVRHMLSTSAKLRQSPEYALFAFVRQNKAANQVYLIPVHLQRFRLATGACIFVDYKSHPYKDKEVLEWFDRLHQAELCYGALTTRKPELLRELARHYGVTHVVVGRHEVAGEHGFIEVYQDPYYRVLRINSS